MMVQLLLAVVTVNLALSVIVYQAYTLKRLRSHGKQYSAGFDISGGCPNMHVTIRIKRRKL